MLLLLRMSPIIYGLVPYTIYYSYIDNMNKCLRMFTTIADGEQVSVSLGDSLSSAKYEYIPGSS